jgi:hypothetical protein
MMGMLGDSLPTYFVIGDMSTRATGDPSTVNTADTTAAITEDALAPIKGPVWLEGAVERRLITMPDDPSGIEALAFLVIAFDPTAVPALDSTEMTDVLTPILGEVEDPFVRSLSEPYSGEMEIAPVATIADFSTAFFADAPGNRLDFGLLLFWNGPNFQVVMISGRGDAILQQLVDISTEWALTGGAGENGWRIQEPDSDAPRTEGLWALLPLPGQLDSLPLSVRFDEDRLIAVGE